MKRLIKILAVSTLGVLMIGCSKDSSEGQISSTNYELKLRGDIKAPTSGTRVNANGFEANDKVGVYVSSTGSLASQGNTLDNAAYTYSNGNLNASEGSEVYWDSKDALLSVYAYYPYVANVANNSAYEFSVETNQSTDVNFYNSDFITAQAVNLAPQETPVSLTFTHSLSKVLVSFVAGEGITASELAAAEKTFTIGGLATSGTINLATGVATAGTTTATITPLESNGTDYAAIIYPQDGAVSFNLELDGEVFSYTTNIDFEAGYQYKFNLTINTWNSPEMTLTTTSIDSWDDGDDHSGTMSNTISFPDATLKSVILNSYLYTRHENGAVGEQTETLIDANGDGEISYDEAKAVYVLVLQSSSISNLSGLEYFTNLDYLVITGSAMASIDLSSCTSLIQFDFHSNSGTTSLKLSNNPNLKRIGCGSNSNLKTLDISGATSLEDLMCSGNAIEVLDVSNNLSLSSVSISGEQSLQTLYVHSSQNTEGWRLPNGVTPTIKN
ncbi:MAG: fimbrillin family protein [Alistipes sp.]|nr:fimbrillin family protein [Alistipes sp.]